MVEFWTDQEILHDWMEERLGLKIDGISTFFAMSNNTGMTICGVTNYTKYDCDVMVATTGKRAPLMMAWHHLLEYVFRVCGCKRLTSKVDASNRRAIRMNKLGGMTLEGVMRKGNPDNGEDVHVFSILKEETKWASQ